MKKKISLILTICMIFLCLTGCSDEQKTDGVEIYNKSYTVFDNVVIKIKAGYFYDKHEKFTVDENTIGLTIYFSREVEEPWD
jgi:hypothetical protein